MFQLYLAYEWYFAAVQLALAMLGMGATLRVADFVDVVRRPRALLVGGAVQIVGIPLVAVAANAALQPPSGVAFGLILVAAMPGGAMSNVLTYFAKGNVPLSIALTGLVTLSCIVTTPVVLRLLTGPLVPPDFVMPVASIAFDIAACLLVPLAIGMALGAAAPASRGALARWCIRGSLAVVVCIAIGAAGAGRLDPAAYGPAALLAILALAFAAQQAGTLAGWLVGLPRADVGAIAIETNIRNTNLALLLKASLFPAVPDGADPMADAVLFVALLYGGMAGPLAVPLVLLHRRWARREAAGRGT